jgi:hypothetical protein
LKLDGERGTVTDVDNDRLRLLWTWLYGSRDRSASPVVPDSRQIHRLNRVLAVPAAARELERTFNLERAFIYTKSREEYVAEILASVRSSLQDLLATASAEGPLSTKTKAREHVEAAKDEFIKIQRVLTKIKESLEL